MSDAVTVRPKDWVPFRCRLCGNCCRNLRGNLMPEQIDAYRLARFLQERGEVEYMEDFYTRYTYPDMLEGFFPVFLINTVDPDDSCVFLKDGRCSVYEARPRVCRLYPFTAFPGQRGKAFHFFQCMDSNSAHFSDGKILIKDWMYQNFSREDREFLTAESDTLLELGRLLKAMSTDGRKENLFQILYYRYYNYDLDQPFMPQYKENTVELKRILQELLRR
ncbi:YkgJ family cysteine cluster protein [bacterium 1xD42-67]|nr:YkgJ family cysteine cluster protein [bacterium 1xD42-67]